MTREKLLDTIRDCRERLCAGFPAGPQNFTPFKNDPLTREQAYWEAKQRWEKSINDFIKICLYQIKAIESATWEKKSYE